MEKRKEGRVGNREKREKEMKEGLQGMWVIEGKGAFEKTTVITGYY
jgi:hypothetical protein